MISFTTPELAVQFEAWVTHENNTNYWYWVDAENAEDRDVGFEEYMEDLEEGEPEALKEEFEHRLANNLL